MNKTRSTYLMFAHFPLVRVYYIFVVCFFLCYPSVAIAVPPEPVLEIYRPFGEDPYLNISVQKKLGNIQIPYANANVIISGPDNFSKAFTANLLGNIRFSPFEIISAFKTGLEEFTLTATVYLDGKQARQSITLLNEEAFIYLMDAADVLIDNGNRLAKKGRFREAITKYEEALSMNPSSARATYNSALAYEKLGMYYLAVSKYSNYLLKYFADAQDRQATKAKVIKIVKMLHPPPLIPQSVLKLMDEAKKAVKAHKYLDAICWYEVVQSLVPWWQEPYYSQGLVFEHLGYQNSVHYLTPAIQSFNLFLKSADPEDTRIADVKKKIEDMEKIEEGLKLPKTIRVRDR